MTVHRLGARVPPPSGLHRYSVIRIRLSPTRSHRRQGAVFPSSAERETSVSSGIAGSNHGDIQRARTDAGRRDHLVRSLSVGLVASRAATAVRERTTVDQVRFGLCVGRARGRHATMDGWQVVECQQSVGQLFNLPGNGRETRREWLCGAVGGLESGENAGERSRE